MNIINKINYVGRLKFRINVLSVVSNYILITGDNVFSGICYFWICELAAFLQQVYL